MIILPAMSALASTVLIQLRLHDLWRIRDESRVEFVDLSERGHIRLGSCHSELECQKAHEDLANEFRSVEKEILDQWFSARRKTSLKPLSAGS